MKNNHHILIVEDSPTQAALLEEALRIRGFRTQIAANGSLALQSVCQQRPTLIVSDVRMPVMNGFQLCRAVKQDPDLRRIPVILLTALTTPADVLASLEAGADFYIPKPYHDDYLAAKITEVLSRCNDDGCEPSEANHSVTFDGMTYQISTSRDHMLRLLLSTYVVAIQRNQELQKTQEELQTLNETLEEKVRDRTASLTAEIIERQRAEKELEEKNAELANLNKLKNHFLSMAAHDLRHPLGIIATCSQFLLKEAAGSLSQKHLQFVEFIEKSSSFMLSLLTNLLDYAKIEAGKLDLDVQPTDLVALAQRVASLSQMLADRKGIQIRVLDSEPIPPVSLDAMKMEQVLNNLISNAVKFSASETTVSIQVRPCGDRVTVSVADQGPGISEQDQVKLFQPFSRISVRSPDGQQSTGLGLAIVRKIVLGHRGEIWVDSEVGRGSTFHFSLPFVQSVISEQVTKEPMR
jgi:signal transduction histidine kinase